MTPDPGSTRTLFELEPPGREVSPGIIGTLARGGGTLVGVIVNGMIRTWLADGEGQLTLVMWPRNFRARYDPLEIIDHHGQVIAHGGRVVLLTGGYLKTKDPRSLGHRQVFSAWQASDANDRGR
ncbi:MAG TPA: hypothetical protein VGG41_07495 [Solirubrobacteraceae bacterium]